MNKSKVEFRPDTIYHVYAHGNGNENIFREDENYRFFLKRYSKYIEPIAKTYAFCLMPNHFHFMIAVRNEEDLGTYFNSKYLHLDPPSFGNFADLLSKQFKNLLISYAKAFNKKYTRKGKLFAENLKRKPVKNKTYYKKLITYIYQNPIHHGFVNDIAEWPYSSYHLVLSEKKTQLHRKDVLSWFNCKTDFIDYHNKVHEIDKKILAEA